MMRFFFLAQQDLTMGHVAYKQMKRKQRRINSGR